MGKRQKLQAARNACFDERAGASSSSDFLDNDAPEKGSGILDPVKNIHFYLKEGIQGYAEENYLPIAQNLDLDAIQQFLRHVSVRR